MRHAAKLVLASNNLNKWQEFKDLFRKDMPELELVLASSVIRNSDKIDHVETHATYAENALAKARLANHGCHYPCFADDSGLEVAYLDSLPGVRSKRISSGEKNLTTDNSRIEWILTQLQNLPLEKRQARFVCALALVMEGIEIHATGTVNGHILEHPRGSLGFGYDPIFLPIGFEKSFGEMGAAEKNLLSHRANAVGALTQKLAELNLTFVQP